MFSFLLRKVIVQRVRQEACHNFWGSPSQSRILVPVNRAALYQVGSINCSAVYSGWQPLWAEFFHFCSLLPLKSGVDRRLNGGPWACKAGPLPWSHSSSLTSWDVCFLDIWECGILVVLSGIWVGRNHVVTGPAHILWGTACCHSGFFFLKKKTQFSLANFEIRKSGIRGRANSHRPIKGQKRENPFSSSIEELLCTLTCMFL